VSYSTCAAIIEAAAAAEVSFKLDGDRLLMKAPKKPPEELLERVRQHKPAVIAALRAEQFLAAIRTIWHDARMLTDAEMAEGSQFREQLILVREANAQVYASPTPCVRK
jgi:hypothetical protein